MFLFIFFVVFFFKQKTAYEMRISDWSSDVCSSDLDRTREIGRIVHRNAGKIDLRNERVERQTAMLRLFAQSVPEKRFKADRRLAALLDAMELHELGDLWIAAYVRWEVGVLADLGYGLDLDSCAVPGRHDDQLGQASGRERVWKDG